MTDKAKNGPSEATSKTAEDPNKALFEKAQKAHETEAKELEAKEAARQSAHEKMRVAAKAK